VGAAERPADMSPLLRQDALAPLGVSLGVAGWEAGGHPRDLGGDAAPPRRDLRLARV